MLEKSITNGANFFATVVAMKRVMTSLEDKNLGSDLLKKIEKEGQDIPDLRKSTSALLDPELGALLLWYTKEAKSAQELKAENLIKWNKIFTE